MFKKWTHIAYIFNASKDTVGHYSIALFVLLLLSLINTSGHYYRAGILFNLLFVGDMVCYYKRGAEIWSNLGVPGF